MQTMLRTLCLCLWAALSNTIAHAAEPVDRGTLTTDELLLESKHVEPTADGLRVYLRSLQPGERQRELVASLIAELGSTESFAAREAAMSRLAALPVVPLDALVRAAAGSDPEIRWRAQRILTAGGQESQNLLHAAFRVIANKRFAGLASELLLCIPACDKAYLVRAAREAVRATATKNDAQRLRDALADENPAVRAAAIAGLAHALGQQSADDVTRLLSDHIDAVRVEAARSLASFGDRTALPVLAKLLSADDAGVRFAAFAALRDVSGEEHGYSAFAPAEQRDQAAQEWVRWAEGHGQTARLRSVKPLGINDGYLQAGTILEGGYQIAASGYFRDSLYLVVLQPAGMNFATAKDLAARLGGHLACVADAEEDDFIVKLNQTAGSNTPWIGLTDVDVEGQWKWETGEKASFTNWAGGEPNNLGDEDAVQIHARGTWNDANVSGAIAACVVEIPR